MYYMTFYSEVKFSVKPYYSRYLEVNNLVKSRWSADETYRPYLQIEYTCMYSNNIVKSKKIMVCQIVWWYLNNLQGMHALIWVVLHDANFVLKGWKKIIRQDEQNIPAGSQNYIVNVNIKSKSTLNYKLRISFFWDLILCTCTTTNYPTSTCR